MEQEGLQGVEEGRSVALQTACPQGWLCSIATLCFWELSSPGKWLSCVVTHMLPKTRGSARSQLKNGVGGKTVIFLQLLHDRVP